MTPRFRPAGLTEETRYLLGSVCKLRVVGSCSFPLRLRVVWDPRRAFRARELPSKPERPLITSLGPVQGGVNSRHSREGIARKEKIFLILHVFGRDAS